MNVELTNPIALLLLALVPVTLYFTRHSLANLSGLRGTVSLSSRVLILLLVVLALGGLRLRSSSRDLALIFVVDLSASTSPDEQRDVVDFINRQIDRASPRDYIAVVAFAQDALVEVAPTRREILGDWRLTGISSNPTREYTDIAGALRLAAALVPEAAVGRLVLLSDGNENLESAVEESRLLKAEGVEVYARYMRTVSERAVRQGEVAVRELAVPQMPAEGEAFDLKATVDSSRDTDAVLRVFRNDSVVAERPVHLSAEGENVFVMPQRLDQKGFYTYRAEIEATQADGFTQNNTREAFALVEGRPRALYLYGDRQPSPGLIRVLTEGNFGPDVRTAGGLPPKLAGLQNYDLVIFDNVPATALTEDQMRMIQSYVKDLGGGFMMVGGDQSFGPGGYFKTPIEQTLPVSLDVRQKKHFPSLALALVIDKSGSMLGTKIQLALEAASAAVDFLSERDSVEVVAFDDSAHAVVKLTNVEDKKAITSEIATIQAIGGTNIYAGLEMAHESLAASDAQIKHIILLSDGQSEGNFPTIIRRINEGGITLSSVAIGDDADLPLMKMLAQQGGGRFYATDAAENLPRIFTREAFLASRSTLIEEPFIPRLVRSTQATAGIDWSAAPQLGGYVGTAERDSLQSPAITSLISDKDDPVYAVWQYGLGRAAAFTSDAKSQWAGGWMNWPGFGQFWTQAMRDTIRLENTSSLVPRVDISAGKGRVTVEALSPEGDFRNKLRLRARVVGPDFSAEEIPLDQTAAGRYEGEFAAARRGAYLVSVTEEGGEAAPVTGSVNSYSPEFGISRGDATLLARICEETGGRLISARGSASGDSVDASDDLDLFERRAVKHAPREIWEALMLAALLLLPVDVGVRRLHLSREQLTEARAWIFSKLGRGKGSATNAEMAASHAKLKDARTRVRLGDDFEDTTAADPSTPLERDPPQPAITRPEAIESMDDEAENVVRISHSEQTDTSKPTSNEDSGKPLASRLLEAKRRKRE